VDITCVSLSSLGQGVDRPFTTSTAITVSIAVFHGDAAGLALALPAVPVADREERPSTFTPR
jgi:hypothetical protein